MFPPLYLWLFPLCLPLLEQLQLEVKTHSKSLLIIWSIDCFYLFFVCDPVLLLRQEDLSVPFNWPAGFSLSVLQEIRSLTAYSTTGPQKNGLCQKTQEFFMGQDSSAFTKTVEECEMVGGLLLKTENITYFSHIYDQFEVTESTKFLVIVQHELEVIRQM